jgi:hypothetical protein
MRWNIHPPVGQGGFKEVAFLCKINKIIIYSMKCKEVNQIIVTYTSQEKY